MLLVIFGSLIVLMSTGLPVAFCFMLINMVGVYLMWGGVESLRQLVLSLMDSLTSFTLLPIPLFLLMGEVIGQSGLAPIMLDTLAKWMGRLPGRLSLLSVAGGTLLATMSGASMASAAMLGKVLLPEMEKRGYKRPMTMGPILGSGGLATMIPPTALGIILCSIGEISAGQLLIAIIVPGLLMAALYAIYIILRCWIQPSLAPAYEVTPTPLSERVKDTVTQVLPAGFIIFLVIGTIFLGVATPTEAAAAGAFGTFILVACYKRLTWQVVSKSLAETMKFTVMILLIISASKAFSQVLAYSGASRSLVQSFVSLPLTAIWIVVAMQIVVLFLGMFMSLVAIMMITLPLFMPVLQTLGVDPVWFGVIMLLNLQTGSITPPYGLDLFTMKGVAPPGTTMAEVYRAALPFCVLNVVAMVSILVFPPIAMWLPGLTG